jgi:hypothetical protein
MFRAYRITKEESKKTIGIILTLASSQERRALQERLAIKECTYLEPGGPLGPVQPPLLSGRPRLAMQDCTYLESRGASWSSSAILGPVRPFYHKAYTVKENTYLKRPPGSLKVKSG